MRVILTLAFTACVQYASASSEGFSYGRPNDGVLSLGSGNDQICFDGLGCFNRAPIGHLPAHPDAVSPHYHVNAEKSQKTIQWNDPNLSTVDSIFEGKTRLIFVTHGFGEHGSKQWMQDMKDALFKVYGKDLVVVLICWKDGAFIPLYPRSSANVALVAKMTVNFSQRVLAKYPTITPSGIQFIGFSLGGQMSGYFARMFQNATGSKIGRVTALDAAAPMFEEHGIFPRKGEAEFVEAIHTSAGESMIIGKLGVKQAYGDVDFFVNGGISQPGCNSLRPHCDHMRAPQVYLSALDTMAKCKIEGKECDTVKDANNGKCRKKLPGFYIGMRSDDGSLPNIKSSKIVYVETNAKAPYCK